MKFTEYIIGVLASSAQAGVQDWVTWTANTEEDKPPIEFFVETGSMFSPDAEPLTPKNLPAYQDALQVVGNVTGGDYTYGPALFVARQRGVRPDNHQYPSDVRLHPLFDDAGPPPEAAPDPPSHQEPLPEPEPVGVQP